MHPLNATVSARRVGPGVMGELGVHRNPDDFGIPFLELVQSIGERKNFSGAHKREVQRVEKQNDFFAFELA